jgi:hypothetical protein
MYDIIDILDLCHLEADKWRESRGGSVEEKAPGCFQPFDLLPMEPVFAHKIGSHIKELNQQLEGIHKEADKYKFNISLGSNLEARKLTAVEMNGQKMSLSSTSHPLLVKRSRWIQKSLANYLSPMTTTTSRWCPS